MKPLNLKLNHQDTHSFWLTILTLLTVVFCFNAYGRAVPLQSWSKPFDNGSTKRSIDYQWEDKSGFKQRICALIPSSATSYWFALNYGLVKKARAMGVSLKVYNIKDDLNATQQQELINKCIEQTPHTIIVGAQLGAKFDQLVTSLNTKSTVIAVGKNLLSKNINASSSVSFGDVGQHLAKYMNKRHTSSQVNQTVLFPGDQSVQYVSAFVEGFTPVINANKYKINDILYAPNSYLQIKNQLTQYLNNNLNTTTIVGSALVAQAAVEVLDEMSLSADVQIISYELSAQVYRGIQRGNISASITNPPVIQGFLAIDMAMKLNNNQLREHHISPIATLVDSDNILDFDISQVFAPYGYRETLEVN